MTLVVLLLIPLLGIIALVACKEPGNVVRVALFTGALEVVAIVNAVWRIRVAGVLPGEPDVIEHSPFEQEVLLVDYAQMAVKRVGTDVEDVPSINQQLSAARQVEF